MDPVTVAIVGAGDRGSTYAAWCLQNHELARVVAVADPWLERSDAFAELHGLDERQVFADWRHLVAAPKVADAVLICTRDHDHVEPAVAFLEAGYDVLLEKPMATTLEGCQRVADAVRRTGHVFALCHVLRFTPYTRLIKSLLPCIGEVMSIQHLEPVGWYHFAHSFVRGNWRREDESSSMLLAKSCHDIDWLIDIVGAPIRAAASFGQLSHFTAGNKPVGAADRCLDCHLERSCAYSATKIYLDRAAAGDVGWPVKIITSDRSPEGVRKALATGPYGRCVYGCDNDVVDHQVVSMQFEGGATGAFTMSAFTELTSRKTRIFGSQGRLECNGSQIDLLDFSTGEHTGHEVLQDGTADAGGGHDGGDAGLMEAFFAAVGEGDQSLVSSDAEASLASYRAVFSIEQARRSGFLVTID